MPENTLAPESKPIAAPPLPDPTNIPAEMKATRQWLTWTWGEVRSNGKPMKPPTDPKTGRRADKTDPNVWTTFDDAYEAAKQRGHGVGFVCINGWCGVDLDHCLLDGRVPTPEAREIIERLNSYTERSPSRDGLHVFIKATLPDDVNVKQPIPFEMYSTSGGYLTVTGDVAKDYAVPVAERHAEAQELYDRFKGTCASGPVTSERRKVRAAITLSDNELWERIQQSKQVEKFNRLWNGDTSEESGDHSAADLVLCSILAWWLDGNAERIDSWFRRADNKLMRAKWDERHGEHTYGHRTILTALGATTSAHKNGIPPFEKGFCAHGFEIRDESSLYHVESDMKGNLIETRVASLIEILGEARDANGAGWSLLVAIKDRDGILREHLLPRALTEEPRELFKFLAERGATLPQGDGRRFLLKYLTCGTAGKRVRLVKVTGWHGNVFVLPSGSFGKTDETFTFDGDRVQHPYQVAGSLEAWRDELAGLCVGNSRMLFAVSAGFAGPLLPFATSASPGFHLFGLSSTGKTSTLHAAASVCGGGQTASGYLESWRATANGLERVAGLHNHSLLCLDELKELDPRQTGEVLYMLGNGCGKIRMRRDTTLATVPAWQLVTLSTGEPSAEDYAREGGKRLRGGQRVRMVDIPADAGRGLGVFEDIHGCVNPAAFARRVVKAARQNYGYAFRGFLNGLTGNREAVAERYRARVRVIAARLSSKAGKTESGEVYRVAEHFALISGAGEIASELGITGWSAGAAERAAEICFRAWFEKRGTVGSSDAEAMVQFVRLLIERDGASRFQSINSEGSERLVVINRLGFCWTEKRTRIYFFTAEMFRDECARAGFDVEHVAKALNAVGMLRPDADGHLQIKKRVPDGGRPRGYAVILPDEDEVQLNLAA